MIGVVKKRYPKAYQALIHERDIVMGKRLAKLMKENPNTPIMAVIGAGHEEGIMKIIDKELKQ